MAWQRSVAFSSLLLGVALGCESPFEPRGDGERVPIGQVIEHEVIGDSADWYSFEASPKVLYVVFLEALRGSAYLIVSDSSHQSQFTYVVASTGGPKLLENASGTVGTQNGGVYQLRVTRVPPNTTARYRFMVYAIDQAPELVPDHFTLGDTVIGESIDPMVDQDSFSVHGDAGQEIVAVAEAQGPAGTGSLLLTVIDPVANNFLGYEVVDAGTSRPVTTGRVRFPESRDYRFFFGSVISNQSPRYRGPYRFWSYILNRAPEHRLGTIPFNTEIGNEPIDQAGDIDEFSFQAAASTDFNAFVQASWAIQLEVAPLTGPALAAVAAQASDTALFAHGTNPIHITQAGTYVVRVFGTNATLRADTGAYRFSLYAIDPKPEHVSATITPGDTVAGEEIELPGDVDEFTFTGVAGEEFNAFLQAQNGRPETRLWLDVLDHTGTVLRRAESFGSDTSLLRQAGGRFALPGSGTYRLRVSEAQIVGAFDYQCPYRLFLYRVNRHPESSPATLAFGDSVSSEATDVPGDVDEFRVRVPDSSGANVAFELEYQPVGGSLTVQLIDSTTGQVLVSRTAYDTTRGALGRLQLGPGTYIVRADGNPYGDPSFVQGRYRLWFYRFGYGPEVAADTFMIGDTVSSESVEPWGDDDQFHFYGVKGQHVNLMLQGLAAPTNGWFQAMVTPPPGTTVNPYLFLNSGTAAGALEDHQTTRVELPGTGWYTFELNGGGGSDVERGPYRFTVLPVPSGPEHVSAALVVGDSVTTEPIDTPGDWDEFTLTATPGQELYLIFRGVPGSSGPFPYAHVMDPSTRDTLAFNIGQGERVVGPFLVPASGQAAIAVYQPAGFYRFCYDATCGGLFSFVGPYAFQLLALNRGPENVPATYTVGDTVRGESLFPSGDIDEFVASGTPGEQLTPFYRLPSGPTPASGLIALHVVDPATGSVLVGSNFAVLGNDFNSPGSFTVPATGSFVVRIRAYYADDITTAPYEFFVRRP